MAYCERLCAKIVGTLFLSLKKENHGNLHSPELPYDYAAPEPHISGKIMELHHDKHHANYVAGANTAPERLEEARDKNDFAAINLWEKNLAFNLGGHINHTFFWNNLTPEGKGRPDGEFGEEITKQFGSFEKFQTQFTAAALGLQGSGWAVLAWDALGDRLVTFQLYDQQSNVPVNIVPLGYARYVGARIHLDYGNVKADYVRLGGISSTGITQQKHGQRLRPKVTKCHVGYRVE